MSNPERWLEGSSSLPEDLLKALRDAPAEPNPAQLQALTAQLSAALEHNLPAAGHVAATVRSGIRFKLLTWVGLGVVLGAGGAALVTLAVAEPESSTPAAATVVAPPAPAAVVPSLVTSSEPVPAVLEQKSASAPVHSPASSAVHAAGSAPVEAGGSELELLQRAQGLLSGDPDGALALAQQHARVFPDGVLGQEREVIIVEALLRSGRVAEARSRAHAFAQRYPGSAHTRRIAELIENRAGSP